MIPKKAKVFEKREGSGFEPMGQLGPFYVEFTCSLHTFLISVVFSSVSKTKGQRIRDVTPQKVWWLWPPPFLQSCPCRLSADLKMNVNHRHPE